MNTIKTLLLTVLISFTLCDVTQLVKDTLNSKGISESHPMAAEFLRKAQAFDECVKLQGSVHNAIATLTSASEAVAQEAKGTVSQNTIKNVKAASEHAVKEILKLSEGIKSNVPEIADHFKLSDNTIKAVNAINATLELLSKNVSNLQGSLAALVENRLNAKEAITGFLLAINNVSQTAQKKLEEKLSSL